MMIRSYLTIGLMMAAMTSSFPQDRKPLASIAVALQSAIDESIRNSGAVGVSAAVIFPDGQLWQGAGGISHEGVPITADMLFDIASMQKNFQAALALRLVEDGVMSLDDTLGTWFPPYPNINGKITIRQILNLTSGIHDFVGERNSPFRIGYVNIHHEKMWTWQEIYDAFVREPDFEPGTRCAYSSTNYIVLRHVIEKATRRKQTVLFEDRLLKPLELNHTLADFSKPIPDTVSIAHGWFDKNDDGKPEDISDYSINWVTSLIPMCVYSTPTDMVRWIDALYHRKAVLKENTLKAMLTFVGPVQNEPLMKGYGLGVVDLEMGALFPKWRDVRAYGHLGSAFGYSSFAVYFPDLGTSVSMMFNRGSDAGTNKAIGTVSGAFFDTLFEHLGVKAARDVSSVSDMIKELDESPHDVHLMYKIAKQYQADKEDYEASLLYEKILKEDPEDKYGYRTEALFWKATYDGVIWKKPENLITFISEHKDYKGINDAYRWLAKTYQRRNEMDKAVQVYRERLQTVGKDAEFYNQFGWWVYENRVAAEYETAIECTQVAVTLKPDAHYIWDTLAWLYSVTGAYQKAVDASTKALSLAPEKQYDAYKSALEKIKKSVK